MASKSAWDRIRDFFVRRYAPLSDRKELLALGRRIVGYSFVLGVITGLVYSGLCLLEVRFPGFWRGLFGFFCLSTAMAILLAIDEQPNSGHEERMNDDPPARQRKPSQSALGQQSTIASVLHALFSRRGLFGFVLLALVTVTVLIYYVVVSMSAVEYSGASGITIRLPGQTTHYLPVSSAESWQNTGIKLREGQLAEVTITGRVSPGHLQESGAIADFYKELGKWQANHEAWEKSGEGPEPPPPEAMHLLWPYSSPEGYPEKFYTSGTRVTHYTQDTGLTVQGMRHNTVIGIIIDEGLEPKSADPKARTPGYVWDRDNDQLINLSRANFPHEFRVRKTGELWIVINDADLYRTDNIGSFFVRLTVR